MPDYSQCSQQYFDRPACSIKGMYKARMFESRRKSCRAKLLVSRCATAQTSRAETSALARSHNKCSCIANAISDNYVLLKQRPTIKRTYMEEHRIVLRRSKRSINQRVRSTAVYMFNDFYLRFFYLSLPLPRTRCCCSK